MARRFNTTGPCIPVEHYMLKPEDRCPGVMDLIEQKDFFVIHAPRQSGKTTLLNSLEQKLNAGSQYHVLYCSLESVQGLNALEKAIPAILACVREALSYHPALASLSVEVPQDQGLNVALKSYLTLLCRASRLPVVVFFDEADCLGGETLISFLRQLRDGYVNRIRVNFLHSLALVGMRNIRDFKAQVRPDSDTLGSASPFNIAKEALTLKCFSREFGAGTRRVDVCVEYAGRRYPVELKLMRGPKTREEGLDQLAKYMDGLGCKEGWLLLFDVDSAAPWEQRLLWETVERESRTIHIVGT